MMLFTSANKVSGSPGMSASRNPRAISDVASSLVSPLLLNLLVVDASYLYFLEFIGFASTMPKPMDRDFPIPM